MRRYNEFLYDTIGNEYERKNLFIKDYISIQNEIDNSSDYDEKKKLKIKLKEFLKNREGHSYIKNLKDYEIKKKEFESSLKLKSKEYRQSLTNESSQKIKKYKSMLFEATQRVVFYKKYQDLCYDAEFHYMDSKIIRDQIGDVINHLQVNIDNLKLLNENIEKLNKKDLDQEKKEFKEYKKDQNSILKERVDLLNQKYKQGSISKQAVLNGKKHAKIERKAKLSSKKHDMTKRFIKESIKNKYYEATKVSKQKMDVVQENRTNIKNITPIEVEYTKPLNAYLSFLIPGLGQILNHQYVKSIFFLIGTIFIYFIAIPYALGFGNYQGQGIFGFITLAEGAIRIHKSIIYLIEGIIALFLVIFSCVIFIYSFKDVLKVQKYKIKGIRPNKWFETKQNIFESGFPYLVSLPALVLIIFIVIVPIVTTVMLSFTNMDPQHQSKFQWIGFANYLNIIRGKGIAGSVFWNIFGWTIIWTLGATTISIVVGFLLAFMVNNDRVKFKKGFRTVFLLPWAVPGFITIMFFSIMLSREGILTQLIYETTGVLLDVKNSTFQSRIALILLQTWLGSAYVFLLATGVLQSIPGDLYEAADIDGATGWQKLRKITVPIVLFQTAPLLIGQYTFNFNNFSIIYLFNGGGPFNPKVYGNLAGSTDLLISYIYKLTIDNEQQAIGAAISMIISFGLMFFAYIGLKNSKAFKEEKL